MTAPQATTVEVPEGRVAAVRFTPGANELVVGAFTGALRLLSVGSWDTVARLEAHTKSVMAIHVSEPGGPMLTGGSDGLVVAWDLERREERARWKAHPKPVSSVAVAGDRVLTASYDGTVAAWPPGAERLWRTRAFQRNVTAVVPLEEGARCVAAGLGEELVVLATDSGEVAERWPTEGPWTAALRPGPEGRLVASSGDAAVRLLDASGRATWEARIPGKGSYPVAARPAGVAVGWDHHVGVWRPPATDPVAVFDVPVKGVYSLDLSPKGLLAAGCADNRVRVWALDQV